MKPFQSWFDLEVPAIVRKTKRPRTPPLRRPVVIRALCLVAIGTGLAAATLSSAKPTIHGPLITLSVAQPVSAHRTVAEAALR